MIDFLPVTWKCCFYSAHFQPGGMFVKNSNLSTSHYLCASWLTIFDGKDWKNAPPPILEPILDAEKELVPPRKSW